MSRSDQEGKAYLPCERKRANPGGLRAPGCRTTATTLGISWDPDDMPLPRPLTPPQDGLEEEFPWDPSQDEEIMALDSAQIEPSNDKPSKRSPRQLPQKKGSGVPARDFYIRGQSQALAVRNPTSALVETTVQWPTYTGTMSFPTKQNIGTIADSFLQDLRSLTATGYSTKSSTASITASSTISSTASITASSTISSTGSSTGSILTTAVPSFSCSQQDQVSISMSRNCIFV